MFRSIFLKTLRDLRRGLIGWSIGVASLVVVMAVLWPSVRDMPNLQELMKSYPEAMRKIFNIDAISTGAGFLNAELFGGVVPAMFLVFAIGRGARIVAGEEEAGTLEIVLGTPATRTRILLEKAAALAASIGLLGGVLFSITAVSSALAGMGIGLGDLAAASAAMVLLGIEHGFIALAAGAATGRKSLAIALAGVVAFAGYVLFILGALVDALRPWRAASPIHQALGAGPIGAPVDAAFAWLAAGALAVIVVVLRRFDRRDIAV